MKKSRPEFDLVTRRSFVAWGALAAGGVSAKEANIWTPKHPVRLICPFAAGGSVDVASRFVALGLSKHLGQTVIVDNKSGNAGNIGTETAARAAPDGLTLVMGSSSTFGVNPSIYPNLKYDAIKDFQPVSMVSYAPNVLVAHPSVAAKTVSQLVAFAKANPGKLAYASSGHGGAPHLAAELFKLEAGVDLLHVPYRGTGQALADLASGQVQLSFGTSIALMPFIKSGQVRALAVTSPRRLAVLPEVPTMTEVGLPSVSAMSWNGLLVPAGTPKNIVVRLNQAVVRVVESAEFTRDMAKLGAEPMAGTPEEFAAFIRREIDTWANVIKVSNIKFE